MTAPPPGTPPAATPHAASDPPVPAVFARAAAEAAQPPASGPDPVAPATDRQDEPDKTKSKTKASKDTDQDDETPATGVPVIRLLAWVVPVLGVVAGVAVYNESPTLAAIVAAVAFVVLLVALLGAVAQRRQRRRAAAAEKAASKGKPDSGKPGADKPAAKPDKPARPSLWPWRNGSSSTNTTAKGRPTGSAGSPAGPGGSSRSTPSGGKGPGGKDPGGRSPSGKGPSGSDRDSRSRSLLDRFGRKDKSPGSTGKDKSPGGPAKPGADKAAPGRSTAETGGTRSGDRKSLFRNPFRKSTGSGSGSGPGGKRPGSGPGSTAKDAGPGGAGGPRKPKATTPRSPSGGSETGTSDHGLDGTSGGRSKWWRKKRRDAVGDTATDPAPKSGKSPWRSRSKPVDDLDVDDAGFPLSKSKTKAKGSDPSSSGSSPWWRRRKAADPVDPAGASTPGGAGPRPGGRRTPPTGPAGAPLGRSGASTGTRGSAFDDGPPTVIDGTVYVVTDVPPPATPAGPATPTTPTTAAATPPTSRSRPTAAPSHAPTAPAVREHGTTDRKDLLPMDTSTSSTYSARLDLSSVGTLTATLTSVATDARRDAIRLDDDARDLRREAALLGEKEGLHGAGADLLREAVARELDAENRRGLAAEYDARAAQLGAPARQIAS